jgi:electron transfer flavoprotein alpha subunit
MNTKDIYVYVEQRDGVLQDVSFELLSEARKLVSVIHHVHFDVVGILIGSQVKSLAQEVINHGADKVIVADDPQLAHYSTMYYTDIIADIVKTNKPDALLIGASVIGRDLAPRIAARVDTGLTADATKIEINPNETESTELWITRPAFGGNLFGTIVCPNHRPQMATIRPKVLDADFYDGKRKGEVIDYKFTADYEDKVVYKSRIIKETHGVDISKARIIVSGGRGVIDHFDLLQKVADELGATVAASRGVVDRQRAPKEIQVGQTGKTVRPTLYLACGISGAVQHTAGMDKSEFIIAINPDASAPIFGIANVGIVGDALAILPYLIEELKTHKERHIAS